MGIRELRLEASKLGIKNYSKMNKADLEAAINAAKETLFAGIADTSNQIRNDDSKRLGQVAGRSIIVSQSDSEQTIGELLGSFSKGEARQVRKLMRSAGLLRFSALPRIVNGNLAAKAA